MNNSVNSRIAFAVRLGLAGSLLSSMVVHAQTAPAQKPEASLGDVVVTGSRLAVPNETSISPVIGVTDDQLQSSGVTRVEDLLNTLPQVFASQGSNISNGSNGTATINLRNLGANRNLVLVNGRRLGPGDAGGDSAADVNQVPIELIERVDVLTGGASSVYGADAVAGVVNFQMNTHFEGFKFVSNYASNFHTNHDTTGAADAVTAAKDTPAPGHVVTGDTKDLSVVFGFNTGDGKGNSTSYVTYRNVAPVLQSSYDYSACTLNSGYATGTGKFSCGGSSTSFPGRFRLLTAAGKNNSGNQTLGPNGTLVPYSAAVNAYNYGPLNYFQRPDERWTAGNFSHYQFNDNVDVYTELMLMHDVSTAQIAPSGSFYGSGIATPGAGYQLSCSDPQLSSAMVKAWCNGSTSGNFFLNIGRRNVEGGGRQYEYDHNSLRAVVGARGKIDDTWSYDAYAQYNTVDQKSAEGNDLSTTRISNALNVVNDGKGNAVCASALAVSQGCVPWNIFQPNGVTPAALAYLAVPAISTGFVRQYVASANVTGDLDKYGVKLPTAASGVKLNVGVEWREVASGTNPDVELLTGDIAGSGSATLPLAGQIRSSEAFAEANVPLVDDAPWAKSILFNTGYRYSSYNLGFKTNTYKYGLEYTVVDDVRLRASWARAVRAPNVGELYASQVVGLDGSTDPCSGSKPIYSAAQCALEGVSAAQYGNVDSNPASQYNGLSGGNPNLKPETATTKSIGIEYKPSFVHGLRVQVDYSDISINNIIANIGADNILAQCAVNGQYCNDIHRDVNGSIWESNNGFVVDNLVNSPNQLDIRAIDVDASYALPMQDWGKLKFDLLGTMFVNDTGTAGSCLGYYGPKCGIPEPRWRHVFRTDWQTPWKNLNVGLAWRFTDAVLLDGLNPSDSLRAGTGSNAALVAAGSVSNTDQRLASRSYFDLNASIKLNDVVKLRGGINNVLDKDPPIFGASNCSVGQCNGNTFPQVYDALGRYVFIKLEAQF